MSDTSGITQIQPPEKRDKIITTFFSQLLLLLASKHCMLTLAQPLASIINRVDSDAKCISTDL